MSRSGNIITAPVRLSTDLAPLLGSGNDLGGFCTASTINKWAKFKPYRSVQLTTLPEATRGDSPYNFGLSWSQFGSPSSASGGQYLFSPYESDPASSARAAMNSWAYLRPRGRGSAGGNEWYRLLDFDGYNHGATEPIIIMPGQIQASTALSTQATIGALRKETFAAGEIDFSTMAAVKDYYFCLVGYRVVGDPDPQTYFVVSAASKISTGLFAATINFTGNNFPSSRLGNWNIYPCLCSVGSINFYQAAGQSLPSAIYIPLPCAKKWTASVASNQRNAVLYGRKNSNHTTAEYRLVINNDGAAYTFNGVQVWLVHNGTVPPATLQSDERAIYIDNTGTTGQVSIPANGTYDTGWVSTSIQSSLWPDLTLYATCSAGFDRVGPIMPLTPN